MLEAPEEEDEEEDEEEEDLDADLGEDSLEGVLYLYRSFLSSSLGFLWYPLSLDLDLLSSLLSL